MSERNRESMLAALEVLRARSVEAGLPRTVFALDHAIDVLISETRRKGNVGTGIIYRFPREKDET